MIQAGVGEQEMAEQYLRAAMERAVSAVEPARLAAVDKWRNERKKRRILQDTLQTLKGSIRVMCRVRPAAKGEGDIAVATPSDADVVLSLPGKDGRKAFAFDHVFGAGTTQAAVFEEVEPVLDSVLAGFNVCIFAYGQTGSGKTFTMEGKRGDEGLLGINPRALRRIFELIAEKKQLARRRSAGAASAPAGAAWTLTCGLRTETRRTSATSSSRPRRTTRPRRASGRAQRASSRARSRARRSWCPG